MLIGGDSAKAHTCAVWQHKDVCALFACQPTPLVAASCPSGTLPPSWGALTNLQHCNLDSNRLNGPLPGTWSGMAGLKRLFLNNNSLSGGTDCRATIGSTTLFLSNAAGTILFHADFMLWMRPGVEHHVDGSAMAIAPHAHPLLMHGWKQARVGTCTLCTSSRPCAHGKLARVSYRVDQQANRQLLTNLLAGNEGLLFGVLLHCRDLATHLGRFDEAASVCAVCKQTQWAAAGCLVSADCTGAYAAATKCPDRCAAGLGVSCAAVVCSFVTANATYPPSSACAW